MGVPTKKSSLVIKLALKFAFFSLLKLDEGGPLWSRGIKLKYWGGKYYFCGYIPASDYPLESYDIFLHVL